MVSGFLTSPCDQSRIFCGAASLIRIASNVMGFACRSRMPQRSLAGLSSLIRLPKGRSVNIQCLLSRGFLPVLRDQFHVECQALEFLDEHVERLRGARLEEVLALDDRFVDAVAPLHVVGLDGEHLLQRVGGTVRLERPHLHLAEPESQNSTAHPQGTALPAPRGSPPEAGHCWPLSSPAPSRP